MQVIDVLERGIADGTQIGAQLYVSHAGDVVVDQGLGESRPGVPMTTASMMIWFSMTKAVTSTAVAQQWQGGALDVDDRVVEYIPEFGVNGKDVITLRHLLTHTAGIPFADGVLKGRPSSESRAENLERIYRANIDYEPGTRAGYHPGAGMSVLGEIVARTSGLSYEQYVRDAVFNPLAAEDCWVGMPEDRYAAYGDRIGIMHNTESSPPKAIARLDSPEATAVPIPGGNGRGPMRELARVYESMLGYGDPILDPVTVDAISARHRTEMLDETFGIVQDWGLGFAIDTYAMGRHCSRRAFGHGGHQSSIAFCDPEHDVVVACVCNGMPGTERHSARLDAISTAVYVDLGLAKPTDEGRRKPYPKSAF
jgi:CubicO group peptidase (beta-lactamase class C family)